MIAALRATALQYGSKRNATPLCEVRKLSARPKAPSPLRFAGALQSGKASNSQLSENQLQADACHAATE